MRWRVAALIALSGLAAMPAASGAAQRGHAATLAASVRPGTGSARTRFTVSFRAAQTSGLKAHITYRVTAAGPAHGGCQSSVAVDAPAGRAGYIVRVVLAPRGSGWCGGTFHGAVWEILADPCPVPDACPAIVTPPLMVGRFTFRVARG